LLRGIEKNKNKSLRPGLLQKKHNKKNTFYLTSYIFSAIIIAMIQGLIFLSSFYQNRPPRLIRCRYKITITKRYKKMQVNLQKKQYTTSESITCFYYNKSDNNFNNLDFLINKIKSLLESEKTSESVKKQLNRLQYADFNKYDLFFVYSNVLFFGIDKANNTIDFYRDCDYMIDKSILDKFNKNYHCKIDLPAGAKKRKKTEPQKIDASDF
jgi:hypothetical protein